MNLTISGNHLDVTPALRDYAITKLDRATNHFDHVVDMMVLLSIENQAEKDRRQKAECRLNVKGKQLFAKSLSDDMYAALDELADKVARQVDAYKDQVQQHSHQALKRLM